MRFKLQTLASVFLLLQSLSASAQLLDVGTHTSTFTGNTRGFWFTAPTNFTITGVGAPTDAASTNFDVSILRFTAPPPVFSSTTTAFDTLHMSRDNAGSSLIGVSISVTAGQVIGVLGGRRDADNSRTANSYAPAPYASSILGLPVELSRLGMQNRISTSDPSSVGVFTEIGSSIGRLLLFIAPASPDVTNTTSAMQASISALRGVMDRRLSGLALMSSYDCNSFDKHGVCVSFQARDSNFDNFNEGAGVLNAAYRVTPQVRLGAFVDYRGAEKEPSGINFSNDLPTFGAFLRYNQNLNGIGLQAKVLAAFRNGDAMITRGSSLADTEPGSGKASLNSYVISGELGWGFAFSPTMLANPFVGVRYTEAARGAYTEATTPDVEYPISYDQYSQRFTTATAGLRVSGMFTEKVGYQIGAAIEHDIQREFSAYSGTSTISGLESFSLDTNGANNRTRGVGTLGLFYQAQNNMRLTGNVSVRNQAFSSQTAISAIAGFQVAF